MPLEPSPRDGAVRRQALDQTPKARPVVHLGEMGYFKGNDIVNDPLRRENQPPAERKIAPTRAAAPTAPRVAHPDLRYVAADPGGEPPRPEVEFLTRLCHQEITDAAW